MSTISHCAQNNIVSFSCTIEWNKKQNRKDLKLPNWRNITEENFISFHDSAKNGFAIITGAINSLVVIDADEVKAAEKGTPIPPEILEMLEHEAATIVKTPNGRHFYFGYEGEPLKSGTDIRWNNQRIFGLDLRAEGGIILAPPTSYRKNGTQVAYTFTKGTLDELYLLPTKILTALQQQPTVNEIAQEFTESSDEEIANDLLKALKPMRWDNRNDWLMIGIILFNSDLPLSLWDSFSRQSSHYTADGCPKAWKSFKKGNLTIRSLWKMVREDNPAEFARLQRKHINIKALLEPTHLSLAKLFHALRPDDYVLCDGKIGWFERMPNNVWKRRDNEPPSQILSISECLIPIIAEHYQMAKQDYESTTSETSRDIRAAEMKRYMALDALVKNANTIRGVQKYLGGLYSNSSFFELLDSNKHLFAFNNGVYDFSTQEFRPIRPEDYISITCGYDYNPESNAAIRDDILKWFGSMFETTEMRDYFLRKLAYLMNGEKMFQEFDMWQGKGSNGKSLIIRLLENSFGPYCQNLPVTYFTEDSKTGKEAPLPALAECRGARVVWCSEPESGSTLQAGFMKRISGDDTIKTRELYKSNFSFRAQFGVIMLLNEFLKLPRSSEFYAIQRRIRVIHFPFQFMDKPVADNHRLINRDYEKLIASAEWRNEFISLLIDIYNKEIRTMKSFDFPIQVKEITDSFFEENNPIAVWLKKNFDCNADQQYKFTPSELVNVYNAEHKNNQLTAVRFGSFMSALGYHAKKSNGKIFYRGIMRKILEVVEEEEGREGE